MTITNGYCSRQDVQAWISSNANWNGQEDAQIDLAVDAASRAIDLYCRREPGSFVVTTTSSRVFSPQSFFEVLVDDIGSTSGLIVATDMSGDGTFETVWSSTDYQLEPNNANAKGQPYNIIRSVGVKWFPVFDGSGVWMGVTGGRSFYAPGMTLALGSHKRGQATVQVTARWGWPSVPTPIKQATIIQAAMVFEAKGAPAGLMGSPDVGQTRFPTGLHPQARMYVEPFVRDAGGLIP